MIQSKRNYFLTAIFSILSLGASATLASSNEVDLSDVPLYTLGATKSNLIMAVDDSGSMDFEVLFPTNDGAAWWNTGDDSFTGHDQNDDLVGGGVINFNRTGGANVTWKKTVYLFPNGTGAGNRTYGDDTNAHMAIPPLPQYAWARSSEYNKAYFDPAVVYKPWTNYGGQTFGQIDETLAPSDPVRGSYTFDLTQNIRSNTEDFTFRLYDGMVVPKGTVYSDGTWRIAGVDININATTDWGIEYFPATFYLPASTSLPVGFGYIGPVTTNGQAPDGTTLNGYEIRPSNFSSSAGYDTAIHNFANWFSYYRKRHLAIRAGIGQSFADIRNLRVGSFTINNRNNVTMWDLANTADRDTFYGTFYGYGGSGGTPNRQAMRHIGQQFMRTNAGAPITASCQQNFGTLFTDGYATLWTGAGVGNVDDDAPHGGVPPYTDTVANTIADISMHYYTNNLRSDLTPGDVPIPSACSNANPDPRLDCNADPHMVTFGIVLGRKGEIFEVDTAATADPYANPPAWPTAFSTRGPSAIDDLWHATLNGRGAMLNAKTPAAISTAFKSVLNNIESRLSSAAAVALNTGSISADSKIYQARFNSATWAGQLLAFSIESDGSIGSELWNASDEIPTAASRNIFTHNGSGGTIFQWNNLSPAQQAVLNTDITNTTDALGEKRLSYLRGDDSGEARNGGPFRNRPVSVLGDIINSAPIYVATPAFRYSDSLESAPYSSFQSTNTSRTPMLYSGANDGMLHGFDATDGEEILAYVPSMVYDNLSRLTSPQYSHTYYVDGTPTVGDAFFLGAWKTVLVGGLNAGGQGIYALNVTDPDSFDHTNVLWEFTDPELGYTFSRPNIVRMANGVWAAVFGNGYNNTEADGSPSSTGNAVLFIVNLQTGAIIKKISTETGTSADPSGLGRPNALATVTPIDSNGDATVDAIYAGDLFGNVWKFDVSNSNPANWQSAFLSVGVPTPLFTACASATVPCPRTDIQPITSRMDVGRGSQGSGIMVYFGTGKYVGSGDLGDLSTQTFYGILDRGTPITDRSNLMQQSIIFEGSIATQGGNTPPFDVRATTDNSMTTESGWYLDLTSPNVGPATGERVVSDPILNAGRIIFTTLIPDTAACSFGGQGWLMELDALSGSRLAYTPFDLTGDGKFTDDDFIELSDGTIVAVSGKKDDQILSAPGILNDGDREFKYISGSAGNINITIESTSGPRTGRQSWQQLK